jgi:hypothetical protein
MKPKRKKKGPGSHTIPFEGVLPMTSGPPSRPHLQNIPQPLNNTTLGNKYLIHGPFVVSQLANYIRIPDTNAISDFISW